MEKNNEEFISAGNGIEKNELLKTESHVFMYRLDNTAPQVHTLHRHDFYSVDYIYEGEFTQIINGKECSCPTGSVCLLSPFDNHQYINTSPASMLSLIFNDDVIFEKVWEALSIDSTPYFTVLSGDDSSKIMSELETVEAELCSNLPLSASFIKSTVNRIVIDIIRKSSPAVFPQPQKHDSVHKSIGYVRYHFREPLTLEETAKIYHVTPAHFCKYFKKHTGSTFKEYIVSLRLDYAMRLIKTTDKSITEICFESGFSSPSYFAKAFFKRFGKIPSQMRT